MMKSKLPLFLALVAPMYVHSGSLYLCRAYSGGTFWAQAHCNQHNALIERIVSVPDNLPFDQQVNLGEQERQQKNSNANNVNTVTNIVTNTTTSVNSNLAATKIAECKALDVEITQLDAMARQPQSGQAQDQISERKRKVRDRQFGLKC